MLCKLSPLGKVGRICICVKTCYDAALIEQKFNCFSDSFVHFEIELNSKFFNIIVIVAIYKPPNTSIVNFNNVFLCYASLFSKCKSTV